MDIECSSRQTWRYLVHTKRSLMFDTIQNVHTSLRKYPWVQRAHNIYFYFCFAGFMIKKYYHVYRSKKYVLGVLLIIILVTYVISLVIAGGEMSQHRPNVSIDVLSRTKCPARFKVYFL